MRTRILIIVVLIIGFVFTSNNVFGCNIAPVAVLTAESEDAVVNCSVVLDGSTSYDPDGSPNYGINGIFIFEWDFEYDGIEENFSPTYWEYSGNAGDGTFDGIATHPFFTAGEHTVGLRVTDIGYPMMSTYTSFTITVRDPIYVDEDATGTPHNGSSWNNAYLYLQDAISAAGSGDEIWVADGNYTPGTTRESSFQMETGVSIYGGFEGNETSREQRNWNEHETILDGDRATSADTDNCYNVVIGANGAILDGFTIRKGNANHASTAQYRSGGGIYINGCSPTIQNCTIKYNYAIKDGGGMRCINSAVPNITNCLFKENKAEDRGGGLYNESSSPIINNSVFCKNETENVSIDMGGAGIYNNNSSPDVINCIFVENDTLGDGGGINNIGDSSDPDIRNCIFYLNYSGFNGGGICNGQFSGGQSSDPIITNCIFWFNSDYYGSGEINNYEGANPVITYCDIEDWSGGTGNFSISPEFYDASDPDGADDIFYTEDDGFRLKLISPCIDRGNGDIAPENDIVGLPRIDIDYGVGLPVTNNGTGTPNYSDIGAYETKQIWFVDGDKANDSGIGNSWTNARKYLHTTLSSVDSGNEIWVKAGMYKPGFNRTDSFALEEDIEVYGGFITGAETMRSERNWRKNVTTLSGDLNDNGLDNNDAYHVVTAADGAILDGFTITGGNANSTGSNANGGGIYIASCTPIIRNCVIKTNEAGDEGGGIYCSNSSSILTNCYFIGNNAVKGGGISIINLSPTLTNCVFTGNTVTETGGGIRNSNSSPKIINCTIYNNTASTSGGGIYNISSISNVAGCTAINSIIWGNSTEVTNSTTRPRFMNCDIEDCGGSGANWVSSLGIDWGGNKETNPGFVNTGNIAGTDTKYMTGDDGLRLKGNSPCIDAAYGNYAPRCDILGKLRFNISSIDNSGSGVPDYTDIGAYECMVGLAVVLSIIDESYLPPYAEMFQYYSEPQAYETHLNQYLNTIDLSGAIVKSACRVPPNTAVYPPLPPGIEPVLPQNYDPPAEIDIQTCTRFPSENELVEIFDDIRDGAIPDHLLIVVDDSGSMHMTNIWANESAFESFADEIREICPNIIIEKRAFWDQGWLNAMNSILEDYVK